VDLDDPVCLCFRVSRRKLEAFVRTQKPRVASQLSQCGSAGTGCGWCVPILRKIFDSGTAADVPHADHVAGRERHLRTMNDE
jgi:bacterioferritin-associated ferredoxin